MLVVGLTGGIGSGKSVAADFFAELGIAIVDADIVAREVVEPGESALQAIVSRFGPDILNPDGTLHRRALRDIIFSQPEQKSWLEALLHPVIRERIKVQLRAAQGPYKLLVSPLLLETDQVEMTDRVLLIDCDPEIQLQRVCQRDQAEAAQIRKIMATQMNRDERLSRADDVILNSGTLETLRADVLALHQRYTAISATQR